ncbi:MAG: hypothetical protein HGB00_00960 [Chlorobiaceae bacterium]|nr:hypothetical protein [Chlorobiaceae bacterium]
MDASSGRSLRHPGGFSSTPRFIPGLLAVLSFLLMLALPAVSQGAGVPALAGRVNDYASMISPQAKAVLEGKLKTLEDAESTQIVILTVPSLEGQPIEDFSIKVAEAWKVGQKGKDNGILLIVSKNDRKIRIEVGYGLEGRLTDLQSGRIINEVIQPAFRSGNIDSGFITGVDAIAASVNGEYKAPPAKKGERNKPSLPLVVIILIVLFIYLRMQRGAHGGGPFMPGGTQGPGGFFMGGGGFGDSGFGGGFSGGGGGFGGGGASGDW